MIWTCPLQMTVVSKLYVDDFHGFHEIFTKMSLHMLLKFHYKLSNIVVRVCVNCGANTPHNNKYPRISKQSKSIYVILRKRIVCGVCVRNLFCNVVSRIISALAIISLRT